MPGKKYIYILHCFSIDLYCEYEMSTFLSRVVTHPLILTMRSWTGKASNCGGFKTHVPRHSADINTFLYTIKYFYILAASTIKVYCNMIMRYLFGVQRAAAWFMHRNDFLINYLLMYRPNCWVSFNFSASFFAHFLNRAVHTNRVGDTFEIVNQLLEGNEILVTLLALSEIYWQLLEFY